MGTIPSTKYCWAPGSCPSVKILSKSVRHGSLGDLDIGKKQEFWEKIKILWKEKNKNLFVFSTECMPTVQEYEKETTETVRGLFEEVDELFYREEHVANPKSSVQASF